MDKKYYFISGLPRSGSTLFSTILKQNPAFHTGISGHLLSHFRSVVETSNNVPRSQFDENKLKRILKATVDAYYADIEKPVVFDTNRLWTNLLPPLKDLYPYTKVILCVRDINWILDSFERLHQKNPYAISSVFPKEHNMHVYSRMSSLMTDGGIVKLPYDSLKSAITGMHSDMLFVLEYELLCKNPEGTMRAIYNFIDQPYYDHDFNNVEISYDEYDQEINMKGLHTTRKKVEWQPRKFVLPPDILEQYSNLEVWRHR